jgi:hypothetical protein
MLEGVFVVSNVIIVVVGICKEIITSYEVVCGGDIRCRQMCFLRVCNDESVFGTTIEVFTEFISQICIRISIADNFDRFVAAY